jgi:hypothetical protein
MRPANCLILIVVITLLSSCSPHAEEGSHEKDADENALIKESIAIFADKQAIEVELVKITMLAYEQSLKESDLDTLELLVQGDEYASLDVAGMKALARYEEFDHIQHTIGMLDRGSKAKGRLLCPAHDLGHYYLYKGLTEEVIASRLLERVKGNLQEWEGLAEAYDRKNPGSLNYQESLEAVKRHLADIEEGIGTPTKEEVSFLTGKGAICFSSDGNATGHADTPEDSHENANEEGAHGENPNEEVEMH